jgi:hypothetical protein
MAAPALADELKAGFADLRQQATTIDDQWIPRDRSPPLQWLALCSEASFRVVSRDDQAIEHPAPRPIVALTFAEPATPAFKLKPFASLRRLAFGNRGDSAWMGASPAIYGRYLC